MSFIDKLQFWKHKDPFANDDVFNTGIGGEPLPPLDDPTSQNIPSDYGNNEPLGQARLTDEEPINPYADPLTPNPLGEQAKYSVPEDPTLPQQGTNYQQVQNFGTKAEFHDLKNLSEEDRLKQEIERKYSPENLARQEELQRNQGQGIQQNQSTTGTPSNRDLEIINLKLDAVKSDVSSITHQLDKIERMLESKNKAW